MTEMNSSANNLGIVDNRYILLEFLGSGISSFVYKARDSTNNKEYALKLINEDAELRNEIEINEFISKSNNPSFVKYITSSVGYFVDEESKSLQTYLILELANKGSVLDYIMKYGEPLKDKLCKLFFAKLLNIVKDLHKMGICHRDLKLENFLFDGEKFIIKLSDFGLSSFILKNKKGKPKRQNEYVGTRKYAAPEILLNIPYDGEKADIFSLGVILFNLKTCNQGFENASIDDPFYQFIKEGKIDNYWKILKQKKGIDGLSEEFKNLYIKMISFKPKNRPTIEEIYNDEWMKEIRDLNEQELNDLEQELIDELKSRE